MTAPTHADQDAELREAVAMPDEFERLRIARDSFKDLAAENAIAADRYAQKASDLRARATVAEAERDTARALLGAYEEQFEETAELITFMGKRRDEIKQEAEANSSALRARIGELERALRDIAQQDRGGVQNILNDGGGDEEIICHLFRQIDRRRDLARAALSHPIPTTQTEEAGND